MGSGYNRKGSKERIVEKRTVERADRRKSGPSKERIVEKRTVEKRGTFVQHISVAYAGHHKVEVCKTIKTNQHSVPK
jgi:hypothetical protein